VALAVAGVVAVFEEQVVWQPFSWFALGRGGVHVDQLAGLFLILTGLVSAPLFMAARSQGQTAALVLRPLLVLCVVGVIVVDNVVLLAVKAGSFSFEQLAHGGPQLSAAVRGVCFALLFGGFAVKAALIPLQTWLPGADADSSGFVAAVSLNVAFYAMLRIWFGLLGHPAVWWAVIALLVGAFTALIGILGGVLQRELRVFVAYSSIENAGLIVAVPLTRKPCIKPSSPSHSETKPLNGGSAAGQGRDRGRRQSVVPARIWRLRWRTRSSR
jgi:formate hydrogenlyase subunit 3/multisubunit Na+/H+ antiporter MnhD subunit